MSNKSNHTIRVKFKPIGIDAHNASDIKEVTFDVSETKSRLKYYKIAEKESVNKNIISKYGIEYWEPYDFTICNPDTSNIKMDDPLETL